MDQKNSLIQILEPFQAFIENRLVQVIPSLGKKTVLRDACEYALLNGGKRFRPFLVLLMAQALNKEVDVSYAALAVEFFHTASLIADDLPCMDNEDLRRNKPSVHKVYGESTALLASYALIAAGYELLVNNAKTLKESGLNHAAHSDRICVIALENATYNTGILGATGGQFLDINPPDLHLDEVRKILCMKTVSLFEISFVLGWVYGGGNLDQLDLIKKAAYHFGMAFQIADDFDDCDQDMQNGRKINLVLACGTESAFSQFQNEIDKFLSIIKTLKINTAEFHGMCEYLKFQVEAIYAKKVFAQP